MQKHTSSKSAAGNSSPLLSFDNTQIDRSKSAAGGAFNQFNSITPVQQDCRASSTIQSQSSGNQASTQTHSSISIESSGALSEFAAMVQSEEGNRTVDLYCPEESHKNAGGAKPDEDDQDGQDKKQRSAKPYSMSRGDKRKSREVKNQQKSRLFLSERSKLYEFSQSNRILLVIPSSQSVNKESCTHIESFN